jgi:hypothetical protein
MDSTTYNYETVVRSELPLLVVMVYLPRIQILVGQSWAGTTLKGWPLGLSGRGSVRLTVGHAGPTSLPILRLSRAVIPVSVPLITSTQRATLGPRTSSIVSALHGQAFKVSSFDHLTIQGPQKGTRTWT